MFLFLRRERLTSSSIVTGRGGVMKDSMCRGKRSKLVPGFDVKTLPRRRSSRKAMALPSHDEGAILSNNKKYKYCFLDYWAGLQAKALCPRLRSRSLASETFMRIQTSRECATRYRSSSSSTGSCRPGGYRKREKKSATSFHKKLPDHLDTYNPLLLPTAKSSR